MSQSSPNLNLPYIQPSQAQKHVTHNMAVQILDALTQLCVEAVDAVSPPVAPAEGETWATGDTPTGAWAGQANRVAVWTNGSWMFLPLREGMLAYDKALGGLMVRSSNAWVSAGGVSAPSQLGVNTSADTTNRLSVASDASLFSHAGAGHQMKINKAAETDTASLLYQTGFSGRAEMGLAGEDAWSIKVSADGASWTTALRVDATTAQVDGAAVQSAATDTTPGKLALAEHVYGPGNLLGNVSQSAGVPTGAVIEHGTTASGTYTRFADGTQICLTEAENFSQADPDFLRATWTYPMPFSSSPSVVPTLSRALSDYTDVTPIDLGPVTFNFSTSTVVMELYRCAGASAFTATAELRNVRVLAVGRWF